MVRSACTDHGARYAFRLQGRLQENDVQKPTAVQVAAIPAIISGRNVAMQCYTGSGKVCSCFVCRNHLFTYSMSANFAYTAKFIDRVLQTLCKACMLNG